MRTIADCGLRIADWSWRGGAILLIALALTSCHRSPQAAAQDDAQSLQKQLEPAAQNLAPKFSSTQQPAPRDTIVAVPERTWLPPAEVFQKPRVTRTRRVEQTVRVTAGADLPQLAAESHPALPAGTHFGVGPALRIDAPDAARAQLSPSAADQGRATFDSDPAIEQSRAAILAAPPALRQNPASPLRLMIPDPFENITFGELRQPPPDDDPPATLAGRPAVGL
jgi:hypothetical protein